MEAKLYADECNEVIFGAFVYEKTRIPAKN